MILLEEAQRKNEEEAFAEVYRVWFDQGPRVIDPWIRAAFKKVLRSIGIQISEELETRATALLMLAS